MPLQLAPLCTATVTVAPSLNIGQGAAGTRSVGEITSVDLRGERLRGQLAGAAAADWMVINGTVGTIDVRMTIRTADGALILVRYSGRLDLAKRENGLYAYVGVLFETGDERYAWLNGIQAAGKGALDVAADGTTTIEYEFCELI